MFLVQSMRLPLRRRMQLVSLRIYSNASLYRLSRTRCENIRNDCDALEGSFIRNGSSVNRASFPKHSFSRQFCSLTKTYRFILSSRTGNHGHKVCDVHPVCRLKSTVSSEWGQQRNKTVMMYVLAGAILVVGFSYAAVPLYTVFCQATGLGGEVNVRYDGDKVGTMSRVDSRKLVIRFNADTAASMRWNFRPQQTEIKVYPGETALAFYSAINPTDKPIIGISTYNVVPFDAGQYFNKIQCFCFEEQRLNPHEQVDMPVFFYIDPDFAEDPKMRKVDTITLSYTFFEAKEGLVLPDPFTRS